MLEEKETGHWRLWASYRQSFGSLVKIESRFEYGSKNNHFQQPFRIHDIFAQFTPREHYSLKLGRIVHWSGLIQTRIDGGEFILKTQRFGSLKLLGGFPADIDFSEEFSLDKRFFLASWGSGGLGKNLVVSYWTKKDKSTDSYLGSNWTFRLFSRLRISGSLAWDLNHGKLYYSRLLLTQRFGKHLFTLGVRNKRYIVSNPYAWVNRKLNIPPVVTLSVTSSLTKQISWWNQLVYRLSDEQTQYVRSTFSYYGYHATILAGKSGDRTLIGSGVGAVKKFTDSWSLGASLMVNALDYSDLMDLQTASGIYGWVAWEPGSNVIIKLFGRYHQNPYYEIDGRGGLVIRVAF